MAAEPFPTDLQQPGFRAPGAPILQPRVSAPTFGFGAQFQLPPSGNSRTPLTALQNVTLPDSIHPFAPTDAGTWQNFNRPDVFPRGPPQTTDAYGQTASAGARLGSFVTQQSGGVTSDSFTNANFYVPSSPLLGEFVNGDFAFIRKGISEEQKFKGSVHGFKQEKVVNLQALNLILAKNTQKHVASMQMTENDMDVEIVTPRFMDIWSQLGSVLNAQPNTRGGGQVISVATSGNRDVLNVWGSKKVPMMSTVGFLGKYIDRAEVRNGQYFPDANACIEDGYDLSSAPSRLYQLVPHVVNYGSTPELADMLSRDNDGVLQQNCWMRIGTMQEYTKVTNGGTRNIFYDAKEKPNLSWVKLHFNCAIPVVS
jgi:hypothetical protein